MLNNALFQILLLLSQFFKPLLGHTRSRAGDEQPCDRLIVQNRPWWGRWIGHWRTTWSTVRSSAPHSQAADEAITHLYKQERKRQTQVQKRLSRIHAVLERIIPAGWVPVSGIKVRLNASGLRWLFATLLLQHPNGGQKSASRARRVMSAFCEVTQHVGDTWATCPTLLRGIWIPNWYFATVTFLNFGVNRAKTFQRCRCVHLKLLHLFKILTCVRQGSQW